jgi:hypothetical protein
MREVHPLNGKNGRAKLNASDENLNPPLARMNGDFNFIFIFLKVI